MRFFPGTDIRSVLYSLCTALTVLIWLSLPTPAYSATNSADKANRDDIRVIIDISGSMKRTDPQNLRAPALRLFTTLLPSNADAGVWTFAQWVNMLVPHGPVSNQWKQHAIKAADDISSVGLFTNIEEALRRATWDWAQPDPNKRRSLILLTDGLVDIAKQQSLNDQSRARILNEILPRLQTADVTINAIALSQDADANLLNQLASATHGWFKTIENTANLEREFLALFDRVADADSLPLKDNLVIIDDSIQEATFLVFRKTPDADVSLVNPSGMMVTQADHSSEFTWHKENRFDLITIKNPARGKWQIEAEMDPDNRVMVVTDLRLKHSSLPATMLSSEPLTFSAHLENKDAVINSQNFLNFVRFELTQFLDSDHQWRYDLSDTGDAGDAEKGDGIYTTQLSEQLPPGEHEISVNVNGTTFTRVSRQIVQVVDEPVSVNIQSPELSRIEVSIIPYPSLIDTTNLTISIAHVLPTGELQQVLAEKASLAEWRATLETHDQEGAHQVKIVLSIVDGSGKPVSYNLQLRKLSLSPSGLSKAVMEKPVIPTAESPVTEDMEGSSEPESPATPVNWLMVSLRVFTFNILLIIVIFGLIKGWAMLKSRIIPFPSEDKAYV